MYVAPRPTFEDDPLFALRLAVGVPSAFIAAMAFQSYLPLMFPALLTGLMAGMRKRFDPKKGLGGPVMFIGVITVLSGIVSLTSNIPIIFALTMFLIYFLSFYIIVSTGNPVGSFFAIFAVLVSAMGVFSYDVMIILRDATIEAAVFCFFAIPILYALIPARTNELIVEDYLPGHGSGHVARALIRAFVLFGLTVWFYFILDISNLIMGVAAVFALCFPTRETLFSEAIERSIATVMGGLVAFAVLFILSLNGHFIMLLLMMSLVALTFGTLMMTGKRSPTVYQFALSAAISLVAGALTNQEPIYSTLTRMLLTFGGAIAAAFLTALLETLVFRQDPQRSKTI